MRTREEQAASLRDSLCADYVSAKVHEAGYELALLHIEEIEQRVRAEIGRDSERLDWLEKARSVVLEDADNGWRVTIGEIEFSLREETARDAIDVAREIE